MDYGSLGYDVVELNRYIHIYTVDEALYYRVLDLLAQWVVT